MSYLRSHRYQRCKTEWPKGILCTLDKSTCVDHYTSAAKLTMPPVRHQPMTLTVFPIYSIKTFPRIDSHSRHSPFTMNNLPLSTTVAVLSIASQFLLFAATAAAQEHESEVHAHDNTVDMSNSHTGEGHAHKLEIGFAPGLVYIPKEKEFTLGLHLHVVAAIGESRWGLGGGLERLFDDHGHTTLSAVVQFRIFDPWSVVVAPGMTISDDAELAPSVHFETAYEFAFGNFHLGPSFEVAVDPNETHLTLGLHMGVGL